MDNYRVKDLMVPLSEYATVREGATLLEAVLALEIAQEEYDHAKYKHRAVLILDNQDKVVGKLGHLDVLCALEPKSDKMEEVAQLQRYGFSPLFIQREQNRHRMRELPFENLCGKAAVLKVEDFMKAPSELECIDENAEPEVAVNQIVMGKHLSLLVTRRGEIVGILRMADVFATVFHMMKECNITTG